MPEHRSRGLPWLGMTQVVQVLLGRGDVNPNTPDSKGQTPLLLAAKERHDRVV